MTPRSGSELLCEALAATGVAGCPTEHFWNFDGVDYPERFGVADYRESLENIYRIGSTPNGVFAVKFGIEGEFFRHVVQVVREAHSLPEEMSAVDVIREGFPNLRIITLTRRNKVRQAVSWWRAIQENIWHVWHSKPMPEPAKEPEYNFHRIDYLVQDVVLREASHQAFLDEFPGPRPLSVVYEDFVADQAGTVRRCLEYLGLEVPESIPDKQDLVRQANATTEEWVRRYQVEKQSKWTQKAWVSFERKEMSPQETVTVVPATERVLQILQVEKPQLDYQVVCGGHVDFPKPGMRSTEMSFAVAGWFLGKHVGAAAVEVVHDELVLGHTPLSIPRPDIAALFPDTAEASRSGFRITVSPDDLHAEFELLVLGVLEDDRRVLLAKITGQITAENKTGKEGPA